MEPGLEADGPGRLNPPTILGHTPGTRGFAAPPKSMYNPFRERSLCSHDLEQFAAVGSSA
jgi:hypothetical protein